MAIFLPNGIGEIAGDSLVTTKPLYADGTVYYVSSVTGDAGSPATNKARPIDTLAAAVALAQNGDIIVLLDGHTETLSSGITIAKSITIVGSGSESGVPTVTFGASASGFPYFTVTLFGGVQIRNVRIKSRTVSDATPRVLIDSEPNVSVIGCYFDCGPNDTGPGLQVDGTSAGFRCENCTFVSTATSATATPGPGLHLEGSTTDARLIGLVFDGGTHGFTSGYGYTEIDASEQGQTRRYAENISMLRGADAHLSLDSQQSYWLPTTSGADARVTL